MYSAQNSNVEFAFEQINGIFLVHLSTKIITTYTILVFVVGNYRILELKASDPVLL